MENKPSGFKRWLRRLGYVLLIVGGLLALYGGIAFVAWQNGRLLQRQQIEQETAAELARQLELAQQDADNGNYDLALRRLEWILTQQPEYPGVRELQTQTRFARDARLTPSPTPTLTPTPTITPTPEPVAELERLQDLVEREEWAEAISAIINFQAVNPNYQRLLTDKLLYDAYVAYGVELLYGEQVELGLAYLAQAEKLGALPVEVSDQAAWGEMYLRGIAFYGVNWNAAIGYFYELCLAAPFYQNACEKLYTARIAYGDQYAAALDWCPAERYYRDALNQTYSRELAQQVDQAQQGCLDATPTPTITPEPTETPAVEATPTP